MLLETKSEIKEKEKNKKTKKILKILIFAKKIILLYSY